MKNTIYEMTNCYGNVVTISLKAVLESVRAIEQRNLDTEWYSHGLCSDVRSALGSLVGEPYWNYNDFMDIIGKLRVIAQDLPQYNPTTAHWFPQEDVKSRLFVVDELLKQIE